MASSTIDALLQATAAPRASDAAPRAGDAPAPFKPALEQALAERPHAAAPTNAALDEDEPTAEAADPTAESHDAEEHSEEQASDVDAAEPVTTAADDAPADEDADKDEVEISEAAAAAAAAAATKANAHQTATDDAAQVEHIKAAASDGKTGDDDQPTETGAADATTKGDAKAKGPALSVHAADEQAAAAATGAAKDDATRDDNSETSAASEKATTKRTGDNPNDDKALRAASAPQDGAVAEGNLEVAPEALEEQLEKDADGDGDDGARNAKRQAGGARSGAQPSEVAAAPATTVDAVAAAVDAASSATNEQLPGDGAGKATHDIAAIGAASRNGDSLERLTAPRGVRPGGAAAETDSAPQVDPARFVSRVEGAMRTAHQRDGRVQVRLSPPELGSLRIELHMQNGGLTAHVEAETASARKLLLDNLPALRERLAQQDIRIEKFEVDVRRDGGQPGGGGPQDRPADQPARHSHDERARSIASRSATAAAARPVPQVAASISDAGLDVRV